MSEFEGLVALILAAVLVAARGPSRRRAISRVPRPRRCAARVSSRRAGLHRSSRAGARDFHRPGAARCRLRRVTARSEGQLGAGHRPGRLRRRPDDDRRCGGRPLPGTGDALGAGDRARRHRRATRRRRCDRGAPPVAAAASPADHPRRRKPAERCQRADDLSAGGRRRCRQRLFLRGGGADVSLRGGRQPGRGAGARVAVPASVRSRPARADRDHSSVRQHVRDLDAGRAHRPVRAC